MSNRLHTAHVKRVSPPLSGGLWLVALQGYSLCFTWRSSRHEDNGKIDTRLLQIIPFRVIGTEPA